MLDGVPPYVCSPQAPGNEPGQQLRGRQGSVESGWGRFSSHGSGAARNGATCPRGHAAKTRGLGESSVLPAEVPGNKQVLPQAGAGKVPHQDHTRPEQRQSSRAAPGLTGMTEGTAAASAAGTGLQTGWEALRGSYSQFPPSFHTLGECFPPKKKWRPWLKRAVFPNMYVHVFWDRGVLLVSVFFQSLMEKY